MRYSITLSNPTFVPDVTGGEVWVHMGCLYLATHFPGETRFVNLRTGCFWNRSSLWGSSAPSDWERVATCITTREA